jgi:hypothetical protein
MFLHNVVYWFLSHCKAIVNVFFTFKGPGCYGLSTLILLVIRISSDMRILDTTGNAYRLVYFFGYNLLTNSVN